MRVCVPFLVVLGAACATSTVQTAPKAVSPQLSEASLAQMLAAQLATSCPNTSPSDPSARERCADQLAHLPVFQGRLRPILVWGAQQPDTGYDLEAAPTTRFDPLVFRRMYLSTFMFDNQYRLEHSAERSIVHVPVHFRYAMDPGEYPYPFWHSEGKWRSYSQTKELMFFLEGGQLIGVLRSAAQDAERPIASHECNNCLEWKSDGAGGSRVALYRFLFSHDNPYVAAVDDAYRSFEKAQRRAECTSCHNPSNPSHMNPLEMFSYPNQALTERNAIVRVLEHNHMPPATKVAPAGIADEAYHQELLHLAREFAQAGDRAMQFEQRSVQ